MYEMLEKHCKHGGGVAKDSQVSVCALHRRMLPAYVASLIIAIWLFPRSIPSGVPYIIKYVCRPAVADPDRPSAVGQI